MWLIAKTTAFKSGHTSQALAWEGGVRGLHDWDREVVRYAKGC